MEFQGGVASKVLLMKKSVYHANYLFLIIKIFIEVLKKHFREIRKGIYFHEFSTLQATSKPKAKSLRYAIEELPIFQNRTASLSADKNCFFLHDPVSVVFLIYGVLFPLEIKACYK